MDTTKPHHGKTVPHCHTVGTLGLEAYQGRKGHRNRARPLSSPPTGGLARHLPAWWGAPSEWSTGGQAMAARHHQLLCLATSTTGASNALLPHC